MPAKILDIISHEDDSNNTYNVIPTLVKLLQSSHDVSSASLCTPSAIQVSKISGEGNHFCGYRNTQMFLLGLPPIHKECIAKTKLTIPEIQAKVEQAWSSGINAHGGIQTGGIRNTRKHIGTPEAEALLLHNSILCTGKVFHSPDAWLQLLDYVEGYFLSSPSSEEPSSSFTYPPEMIKVHRTDLPPIFLQRPRHSLTVIGIERLRNGKRRLLVFDPAWRPPKAITKSQQEGQELASCSRWSAYWILKRYRKSERYLRRFEEFETLVVEKE